MHNALRLTGNNAETNAQQHASVARGDTVAVLPFSEQQERPAAGGSVQSSQCDPSDQGGALLQVQSAQLQTKGTIQVA